MVWELLKQVPLSDNYAMRRVEVLVACPTYSLTLKKSEVILLVIDSSCD